MYKESNNNFLIIPPYTEWTWNEIDDEAGYRESFQMEDVTGKITDSDHEKQIKSVFRIQNKIFKKSEPAVLGCAQGNVSSFGTSKETVKYSISSSSSLIMSSIVTLKKPETEPILVTEV